MHLCFGNLLSASRFNKVWILQLLLLSSRLSTYAVLPCAVIRLYVPVSLTAVCWQDLPPQHSNNDGLRVAYVILGIFDVLATVTTSGPKTKPLVEPMCKTFK